MSLEAVAVVIVAAVAYGVQFGFLKSDLRRIKEDVIDIKNNHLKGVAVRLTVVERRLQAIEKNGALRSEEK